MSFWWTRTSRSCVLKCSKRRYQYSTSSRFAASKPSKLGLSLISAGTVSICAYSVYRYVNSPANKYSSTTPLNALDPPQYANTAALKKGIQEITDIVGIESISTSKNELDSHSDNSSNLHKPHPHERPDLVVYPQNTDQVVQIVKVCYRYKIPMIPLSGATSIEGHFIPTRGGICIDVSKMNKIIQLNEDDLDIIVQPGVGWQEMEEFLKPRNLLFSGDPGPGAMVGGMVATSCSGTNAFRYGTMKENVISLKVVLADGTIIKTKNRPRKSSAGYNLTGLFIGSEGTLGIVVEATLKLHVRPEHEVMAIVNFKSVREAAKTVSDIFRKGVQVNAVELMDKNQMEAIEYAGVTTRSWSADNLLLFKLGGSKSVLSDTLNSVTQIAKQNGGFNIQIAKTDDDKEELWGARKTCLWSSLSWARRSNPGLLCWPTDTAVPVSKLPKVIDETIEDITSSGFKYTFCSHIGDGNLHFLVIFPPEKYHEAEEVINRMTERAISNEGTVSGEHGVGIGKRPFLTKELGQEAVDTMRSIKMSLDPHRLLNPDKIFKIDPLEDRSDH